MNIKKTFDAILTKNCEPYMAKLELGELQKDEILIRIEASPVNPSDRYWAKGLFGVKELLQPGPLGCGFEGSGIVEKVRLF